MKNRGRLMMALSMIGILICTVMPGVNAENFNIGEKMDWDITSPVYHTFTSGAIVRADDFEINLAPLIFDGNLSTGIETNYSMGDLGWKVYFRFPLYVNNITIKPSFGNGSSNFTLTLFLVDTIDREFKLDFDASGEGIFQMNCYISAFNLHIHENGTDQFYFNDLIINYTPTPPHLEGLQNQINEIQSLDNRIFQLESENAALNIEIENLTTEIEKLKEAQDEPDDFVALVPFILSFLSILIAIVAVIFASRKLGEKTPPADKEESEESIHSEEDENKVNEEET